MDLKLNRSSHLPVGEQLAEQIRRGIEAGALEPGGSLPTIREAAEKLGVNPNTVAAVYRQLEAEGYLTGKKRAGTSVAQQPPRNPERSLATWFADELVERARLAGIEGSAVARAVAVSSIGDPAIAAEKPRIAAVGRTPLEAARFAAKVGAVLGAAFTVVPVTPQGYRSVEFHLTLVHPDLTPRLVREVAPERAPAQYPPEHVYGPDFPAGAD